MQTLHPREKSLHTVCLQTVQTLKSLQSALTADLKKKSAQKSAQSLQQVCTECTCSAQILHQNPRFVWEQPRVLKNADFMHTLCRLLQIYCRIDADLYKCVQLEHFFLSYAKYAQYDSCRLCAHLRRHYADIEQTLCRLPYTCASGTLFCCHQWQVSLLCYGFCRTHMASKGRISPRCFPAFRRVEKQEDQG